MEKAELETKFEKVFGAKPEKTFFSPGRINLIGEHTDYNGGHVFPCAITLGTYGAASKRDDSKLNFYSANFEDKGIIEVDLNNLVYDEKDNWTNYAKGMIKFLKEDGYDIDAGMDIFIEGNIPNGSGLSSSSSLELLIGIICQELFGLDTERLDLVKLGQKTENKFIGVNSGIMDQFAIGMGDLERFGRLVNASHVSLEHDYEVTGVELDTLAHEAWKQKGVLGARMTGAGFGGCGIAIVDKDCVEDFKENVGKVYEEKIGYAPSFYIAEVADGTKVLD